MSQNGSASTVQRKTSPAITSISVQSGESGSNGVDQTIQPRSFNERKRVSKRVGAVETIHIRKPKGHQKGNKEIPEGCLLKIEKE